MSQRFIIQAGVKFQQKNSDKRTILVGFAQFFSKKSATKNISTWELQHFGLIHAIS